MTSGPASLGAVMLGLLPLVALVGSLLLGRYPGERGLERVRRAVHRTRHVPCSPPGLAPWRRRWRPGGALLIAHALASRGPPPTAGRASSAMHAT